MQKVHEEVVWSERQTLSAWAAAVAEREKVAAARIHCCGKSDVPLGLDFDRSHMSVCDIQ